MSMGTVFTPPTVHVDRAAATLLGITWVAVLARLYTRGVHMRAMGWDDYTALMTQISYTVFCAAIIIDFRILFEPDFKAFQRDAINRSIDWFLVCSVFYIFTMLIFKIALGLFFLRIMVLQWQRRVVYVAMAASTLISIIYFFFPIFQCGVPKDGVTFILMSLQGKCMSNAAKLGMSYTHAIIISLTDFTFAILPLFLLRSSQMEMKYKVITCFILVLGTAGSICSVIRIRYIHRLTSSQLGFFETAGDFALWTVLEPGIGITASSLATLRPLLRAILNNESPRTSARGSWHLSSRSRQRVSEKDGNALDELNITAKNDGLATVESREANEPLV